MFNNLRIVDFKTACMIFDVKIKPMLLYGSEIWGHQVIEDIERVQIMYFKAFLGIGKTTPNCMVLSEVNRHHLYVDYFLRAVKYWCKLISTSGDRYIKKWNILILNMIL